MAEGGRAMAPRCHVRCQDPPLLAERLAEPWESVKYT